ncbi:MAG: NAD(P)-binding domain-containing protein [Sphingobacteriales bacterium]|jgi:predicted dinucleotide-binding enzyme|nr:NAD(P)-binding domain-containing protein [Sphingobacteriales bacterium]MBP9140553.1 NAD(P)-binding domain-containing protein [Chitinophagales bacterium]MDA0197267.1 NAD(P)-binding domain-containing protein [Bacteroidota bacterium]MBK6890377.1 NAD(P)-binding domain-containing protein [Sphingobacteriales bacterium]MBK7526569.1 NAD(P)-binding domain-containing protein [Sphingobacteriales bacterium]
MQIAVLGTGNVGDTIGSKLIELGHAVMMGSRTADNDKAKAFVAKHKDMASAGTFAEAASFGDIIFNCTAGVGSIAALKMAGEQNLNGKIIVDLANPLDFSKGMPPTLAICNQNSLGEEIQNTFPQAKVVKALNTMWCGLMVNPEMINGGDHSTFVSGNDPNAKETVKQILKSFGWAEKNILDLGDITKSRGTEMYLPVWLSIYMATNNGAFNIKIVS